MQNCTVGRLTIGSGQPVRLMGVINCSPESFYSGSFTPKDQVRRRAEQMIRDGADLIDLGARSTAPGCPFLSVEEEIERIEAALDQLDGSGITISVDTMSPAVLGTCLRHEVHALNDIRGLADPALAALAADAGLPVIAMAANYLPGDPKGVPATLQALQTVINRCEQVGIKDVILDPAVGLWTAERTVEDDWALCTHFMSFTALDYPVLAAVSRKTFIGDLLKKPAEERLAGTLAVTMQLLKAGAAMVRAHDVPETRDLIAVYQKMGGQA